MPRTQSIDGKGLPQPSAADVQMAGTEYLACSVIAIIQAYFFSQSAKASARARYPGRPFSMARMARLPLM